jgi:hypothetical protein
MSIAAKLRRAPGRIVSGAFILNSGIGKLTGTEDQAKALHGMASGAFPVLEKVPPKPFLTTLGVGETALGGAVLMPFVPAGVAGLALTAFSSSLLTLWWRTPGMHAEGSPRPTQQGTAFAKDAWMLGIGLGLLIDAVLTESRVTNEQSRANAKAAIRSEAKLARRSARRVARRARESAVHMLPN